LIAEKNRRAAAKEQDKLRKEQERIDRTKHLNKVRDGLSYSDEIATEICERIASGELLTLLCQDEHMPTVRRCNQWLREHQDFRALYEQSLQDRLSIFEEDLVSIADSAARDYIEVKSKGQTRRVLDPARNQIAKLQIDVRRLHLVAGRPAKWGSVQTLITKSADDDISNLSPEDLERQILEIQAKSSRASRAA
jgi:hypothetical protein